MTDLNKLADALENIAHMEYPSGHHDGNNLREAAALLRTAAGVDVAGLLDAADRYALAKADPAHWRAALELLLRLVLAQRVPPGFVMVPREKAISAREHVPYLGETWRALNDAIAAAPQAKEQTA